MTLMRALGLFALVALSVLAPHAAAQAQITPADPATTTPAPKAASDDDEAKKSDQATPLNTSKRPKAKKLQAIEVTGSLIPQAQIEGPSPVTTITAKDIEKQGFVNTYDALRSLPIANGSVQDAQSTGGFTPGAKTISLFGLSPDFTLTLLDGRPMASYPLAYSGSTNITDIANIPVGLIDHIDVLTGGASSIYGSAAIAGVVNIVLKDHVEGTHLGLRYGDYSAGGGASKRFQLSSGYKWGDLDISGGIQISKQDPIWAYQRKRINSVGDDPDPTGRVDARTFLRENVTENKYIDPGALTCSPLSYLYGGSTTYTSRSSYGNYCGSSRAVGHATLANRETDANGSLFLRYHLSDDTELYSDMMYSYSNPAYVSGSPYWNKTFYNKDTGQYELWQRSFSPEEIGSDAAEQHIFTHTYNVSFGVRGELGNKWNYDAYYNRSQSKTMRKSLDFLALNGVDDYYLGPSLGSQGGYSIYSPNPARLYQPISASIYRDFTATDSANSVSWTQNETITANTTELFSLPAGEVGAAVIAQASNQRFSNASASPLAAEGYFRGVSGYTTASGGSKQYAVGAEMQVPLLKSLTADVSGRYDNYRYGGGQHGKPTYKLGLEWRPFDTLLIRGSYATAFRAPDLFYLFSTHNSGYSTATDYYRCRQKGYNSSNYDNCPIADQSILAVSSGNTKLKDITAKTLTYGFVWSTSDNSLSWSVDYNATHIYNEVVTLGTGEILEQEADCRLGQSENGQTAYDINSPTCQEVIGQVKRLESTDAANPNGISEVDTHPINVASEYQSGIQSTLKYNFRTQYVGAIHFGLDYYDALKHTYKEKSGDPVINYLCCDNSDEFKSRVSGTVTWDISKWSTTLYAIRDGRTWNADGTRKNIGPWITFNGTLSYKATRRITLGVTANNLFNRRPPVDKTNGGWPYYDEGDYNALRRSVYLNLDFDFGT